ncbi:NAD(P)-binding protein [Daedalea quercina L-15889]|uniref:NAD(P)-binding protein n=1 Tax=Daedalea quercina L-15889 TaxID=1314783 RepID=A0A165Q7V3_9APHY|nr:NAD(P)-binding protein [Daedalea quercina L-15889]
MPSLAVVRKANTAISFKRSPVAVFVGGTSGIGQALSQGLARYTQGNSKILLCGRNRSAAEQIIASYPKSSPVSEAGSHSFVESDLFEIKNVQRTTSSLLSSLPKINFLVLSTGFMDFRWRDETAEGIDKRLALTYYARWKFIYDLLPLLRKAKDAGEEARVMSILGPGSGWKVDMDDLGLKRRYNPLKALTSAATYNDLMIESFAELEPRASFIHAFPGLVRTPLMGSVGKLLLYPVSVSPDVCAEYLLYALLQSPAGSSRRNNKGDDMGKKRYYGTDEARTCLWEHTLEEVERALRINSGGRSART